MDLILNIETSTKVCGVSISKDGVLIDDIESKEGNSHAANLAPFIDKLLKRNNLKYTKLSAIAISQGPGSYTGLRIGTSTAKGLCFALDIPLIAINTLHSMAANAKKLHPDNKDVLFSPMIDARRMEVYSQAFDYELNSLDEVTAVIVDEESFKDELDSKTILFFGDGAAKCMDLIIHPNAILVDDAEASAVGMIDLSYQKFLKSDFEDVAYFEPFYLKEFVAAISKVKGLR
ncbi:MAG TPA: tRNA (adenosine(37)-N6)-threonylcarbamoyltransferase complex dimerization subunit type 1 TsaB [Saprospiraceae bacterium]|nr:tRNA (adenosine(37)-N6)-threonylcarbamoyltransferase complex dimerization subunit type 1 TsaB [Saprospiraceae bacterium]